MKGASSALTRTALEKLPKVPPGTTVYREDAKRFYDAYTPGAVVARDGFTSTAAAIDSEFPGDALTEIKTKTGRDISGVSLKPGEKEVLILKLKLEQSANRRGCAGAPSRAGTRTTVSATSWAGASVCVSDS